MKLKLTMFLSFLAISFMATGQQTGTGPSFVGEAELVATVPSLASRINELTSNPVEGEARDGRYSKIRRPKGDVVPGKGNQADYLSNNPDPLTGKIKGKAVDAVWDAGYTGSNPTDPALAVGPAHVFVAWNTEFAIFDLDGNELLGATAPNPAIFPSSGCCDLTVSYDNAADRWVISFLGGGAQIAVSQTGDPLTTAWNIYTIPSVQDYNKLSVGEDASYFLTDQAAGNRLYALDRNAMLAGNATASIQGFPLPGIGTFGFASPQALNVTDGNMPADGNAAIVFFQDDAYAGVNEDHMKIWTADIDYATPANSTISAPLEIPVTPFTSIFDGGGFSNLAQPEGGTPIDALQGIIMNQAQFRKFPTHNSAVFNHVIDIDDTAGKLAAVRWYEFRQDNDTAPWTLYQEGTYSGADGKHAWNASLMMDSQGNIGMGYTAMGGTNGTSLGSYYTGRFPSDPLGTMSITEEVVVLGDGPITGSERYGDYSKIDIDTATDRFFFANEVHTIDTPNNQRAANVGRFKIASDADKDTGVIALVSPVDGDLGATESITVMVRNFGLMPQTDVPVTFSLDGGPVVTETVPGTINPQENVMYTFTATVDLSTDGTTYSINACTALVGDEIPQNDCLVQEVTHLNDNDTGVTSINSPVTATGLGAAEVVTITIENFGAATQTSIPVYYTLDGGAQVMETYTGSIASGGTDTYSFTTTVDLSELSDYVICAGTALASDSDASNDEACSTVSNFICQPGANCTLGDGLRLVNLNEINNATGCDGSGYSDFTDQIANGGQGQTYDITLTTEYGNQFVKIWVDFNDDFTYSDDEVILDDYEIADGENAGSYTETTTVTIPVSAPLGEHTMRIKTNWNEGVPADSCLETTYGETEDYTLNVTEEVLSINEDFYNSEFTINTLENNQFELNFNTTEYTDRLPVRVYNTLGQNLAYYALENNGSGYNKTIDMSFVSAGVYFVKVGTKSLNKVQRIIVK